MQLIVIDDFANLFAIAQAGIFDVLYVLIQRFVGANKMRLAVFFLQQGCELPVLDQELNLIL